MECTLIDKMGTDLSIVNSARVSFSKESQWEWYDPALEPELSEADQKLIKYLAKHNHWTPFSHVQITMREKVPIFVARQVFRSTIGISRNEVSRRYVDDDPHFWLPEEGCFRERPDGSIKQGSGGTHKNSQQWRERCAAKNELDRRFYLEMIEDGIAPEQARAFLPQSMYTEFYTTASLTAWARMYSLRADKHAQGEIQELAAKWNEIISSLPELTYSWKALIE